MCEIKKEMAALSLVLCSLQLKMILFFAFIWKAIGISPGFYNEWLQVNGLQIFNIFVSGIFKHFANIKLSLQHCFSGKGNIPWGLLHAQSGTASAALGCSSYFTVHLDNHS